VPAPTDADAVLVTGVYGAGKSTVVADVGALLGDRGERFGLLDVDWLGWFDSGISHREHRRAVLGNLATVSSGFVIAGVRRLALAWSVRDREQLDEVRLAVPVPLRVVRLEVSLAVVEQRLSADPTEERRGDDLRVAREWLSAGHGAGLEDVALPGDAPVRETSEAICSWLGWT
jgi:adenylylsulfate kinase-like enzyme